MENFSVQMEWALLFSIIWAAFNLAFFAFLRGSEYTYSGVRKFLQQFDLSTECVSFHPSLARSYCITVYLKSSKTNIAREGQSLTIAHTLSPLYAVAAMQEYFLSARPQHGPLFYFQSGRYLTPGIVSDLLRDSARVAGPPYQSLKEHSLRISSASVAAAAGLPDWQSSWSLVLGLLAVYQNSAIYIRVCGSQDGYCSSTLPANLASVFFTCLFVLLFGLGGMLCLACISSG